VNDAERRDSSGVTAGTRAWYAHPAALGLALFALVVIAIVFGPSSDSRFIYTDF
jgi:hypothetical protein